MKTRQILGYVAEGASAALAVGAVIGAFFVWITASALLIGVLVEIVRNAAR